MEMNVLLSMIGLLVSMACLVWLVMRGVNIFLVVFLCVAITAATGGLDVYTAFTDNYMTGFVGFFKANFFVFLTGTLFAKIMEMTNAAKSIAHVLIEKFGPSKAVIAIPLSTGILGYGGVSGFVVSFAVFPIALRVFQEANIPRRFIPGALCFGCSTFAMVAPGSPQIHNAIVARALGTDIMAGAVNGFISCGFMLVAGTIWLYQMIEAERKAGRGFVAKPGDVFTDDPIDSLPNPIIALLPLVATVTLINIKIGGEHIMHLETGLLVGVILAAVLMWKQVDKDQLLPQGAESVKNAVSSISNTCAVVGFGTVVSATVAFPVIVDAMMKVPGPPAVACVLATTIIAGITGSASGGLGIVAPLLGPVFMERGLSADAIHRLMAISSSSLDSLPHNGYIITVTNGICNETHKDAYGPVFKLTVVIPFLASILAIILFTLFPNFP